MQSLFLNVLNPLILTAFFFCFFFQAKTSLTTFPASAEIVSEPLGVVLVISAWNYPFRMFKQSMIDLYSPSELSSIKFDF